MMLSCREKTVAFAGTCREKISSENPWTKVFSCWERTCRDCYSQRRPWKSWTENEVAIGLQWKMGWNERYKNLNPKAYWLWYHNILRNRRRFLLWNWFTPILPLGVISKAATIQAFTATVTNQENLPFLRLRLKTWYNTYHNLMGLNMSLNHDLSRVLMFTICILEVQYIA